MGSLQRQKKPAGRVKLGGKGPKSRLLAMLENIGLGKLGELPLVLNTISQIFYLPGAWRRMSTGWRSG